MADHAPMIQKLRLLGLTRTEAEVYVAVLQESGPDPVSGYKVAQAMGRDPANLGKTLAALEKQGAVRAVQDKPRLYLPILPADFTKALVARIQEVGETLVEQLEQFARPQPTGLTMSLRDNQQALDQAIVLMRSCQSELLIFASRDVIDYLGREFGELASRGNSRVRFLGLEPCGVVMAENTIIDLPEGFTDDGARPWLQMVVDRQAWLVAQFNRSDYSDLPCGWWGDDPAMANIMAGSLDAACHGVPYEFTSPAPPVSEPENVEAPDDSLVYPNDTIVEEPEFESGVINAMGHTEKPEDLTQPVELVQPEVAEVPEVEKPAPLEEEGFTFVVRHEGENEDRDRSTPSPQPGPGKLAEKKGSS